MEEAETAPLIACKGPVNDPSVNPFVPDTVSAVVDAYGNVDARVVEVALNTDAVGVEVPITFPDESVAKSCSFPIAVAPVPPLLTPSVPVTCVARLMRPAREENERQVPEIA